MPARLSAFVIWALVAASAAFWALRLLARAPQAPTHAVAVDNAPAARGDVSRLLGAPPVKAMTTAATPETSSRFRLAGVMAPKTASTQGVALIAVDGKMPRAFNVGASVDGALVLQAVSLRTASIGPAQGRPAVVLELPPLAPPATGTLSANPAVAAPASPMPSPAAPGPAPAATTPAPSPGATVPGMVRRVPGQPAQQVQ